MFEYAAVLGGNLQDVWSGHFLPFYDMIRSSPFFWPGVVAAVLAFVLVTRQIIK
jgi:hypothetical protein